MSNISTHKGNSRFKTLVVIASVLGVIAIGTGGYVVGRNQASTKLETAEYYVTDLNNQLVIQAKKEGTIGFKSSLDGATVIVEMTAPKEMEDVTE